MNIGSIYVDDAGNPGAESGSNFLPSSRKSWTAVIVPSSVADSVEVSIGMFLDGVRDEFGVSELHFTDIYSGRGIWENVAPAKRKEIFDLMKFILDSFSLPIVHQTASDLTLKDHEYVFSSLNKSQKSWWDIKNVSHLGFLLLCSNLYRHITELHKQDPNDFELPMPLIVDEGIAKAGGSIDLPNWGSIIAGQKVHFRSSKDTPGIQIADFAAFVISRTQWIMAKQKNDVPTKRVDLEFLKMASELNILNLPMLPFWPNNLSKESFESLLEEDRCMKGLQDLPIDSILKR